MCQNRVIKDGQLSDPTAHAERQIIDWYYHQPPGTLPEAEELTIVSALDPCLMCAGAILRCGMRVATVSLDEQAGINFAGDFAFLALPPQLRPRARELFGYLGVEGLRSPQGAGRFAGQTIPAQLEQRSSRAFLENLIRVQSQVHGQDVPRLSCIHPLPPTAALLQQTAQRSQSDGHAHDAACLIDSQGHILLSLHGQELALPAQ